MDQPVVACTHMVSGGDRPHVAAVEAALGTAGRAVRWPGHEQAHGVLPAAELRTRCGIDHLEAVAASPSPTTH